jgi:site-specific DNA-methyltransferase (adenine-specific)
LTEDDKLQDGVHHDGKNLDTHKMGWGFKSLDRSPGLGRFPANLIHDGSDEVLALFPDSKGALAPVYGKQGNQKCHTGDNGIYGHYEQRDTPMFPRNDSGSAARFFYCAKASRSERGDFNDHMTVKPLALMRYLVRLVTRKGGVVLDPFMGSGTTGVAAIQEGMHFVGIERDPHYHEIASRRVNDAKPLSQTTQTELPL